MASNSSEWRRQQERLLIAGGGMAGLRLVEELVALVPGRYHIAIVGKEPHSPCNRVLLSGYLAGDLDARDIELRPRRWYAESGVELRCGVAVSAISPAHNTVVLASGEILSYDRLVLATGSNALRLPIPGSRLPGVTTFRDLADVEGLRAAEMGTNAVVIGGGLLGIEAAYGLAKRGLRVTLLHIAPRLMERQLDESAALLLKSAIAKLGIDVVLNARTVSIEGERSAELVVLEDGRTFPTSLVVMAVGVRPETDLAKSAGIEVGRGIQVDDWLETSRPGIYAIGECSEHRGACYGLVEPAHQQAKVLARRLAGLQDRYEGSLEAATLKVSGVPVVSIGDFEGEGADAIVLEDAEAGVYRKLVVRENRLCGAILIGDTTDALWYRELVGQQSTVASIRATLAFGKAYAEAA
jgi:nitrite reductase (NADH) large subunit